MDDPIRTRLKVRLKVHRKIGRDFEIIASLEKKTWESGRADHLWREKGSDQLMSNEVKIIARNNGG